MTATEAAAALEDAQLQQHRPVCRNEPDTERSSVSSG
jgi:hypothetical protein